MAVFKTKIAKSPDANLIEEKDGTWRVQVRLTLPGGEPFNREQRNVPGKIKARKIRDTFLAEYNVLGSGGKMSTAVVVEEPAPKSLTLKDWAEECADKHWPRSVPSTAKEYERAMNRYWIKRLGHIPLVDLTPQLIREAVYEIAENPTTVKRGEKEVKVQLTVNSVKAIKAAIGSCLSMAVEHGHIGINPALGLRMRWASISKKRQIEGTEIDKEEGVRLLTQKEIQCLIKNSKGTPIEAMVLFQSKLGLRISEALVLTPSDFDLGKNVVRIRRQLKRVEVGENTKLRAVPLKTAKSNRNIPLPKSVITYIKKFKGKPDEPFTRNEIGTYLEPRKAQSYWTDLVEACKLVPPPTTHDLRGNFISHLLNDLKVPATVVQELAGHSEVSTTLNYYSKASEGNLTDAMKGIQ